MIFVTGSRFFSDGSIFAFAANACASIGRDTAPSDIATLVEYHAG